jgi:hypothetical protein
MPRVIELIVSKDGQTTVQMKGFSGGTCIQASRWLEQAIGTVNQLRCRVHGWVEVGGISDTPVPWPYRRAKGRHSPILCGDLVRAVRQEANVVVCHLFGVTPQTVTHWRAALGIKHKNPGTSERKAAPRRGVPRPPHVIATWRAGRPSVVSDATRAKISATNRRNGIRPAKGRLRLWTAREDALVRSLRPAEAAKRTRRTLAAIFGHRHELGLPDGRAGRKVPPSPIPGRPWTTSEDELVRTLPASSVAKRTGRTLRAVYGRRHELGVPDGRAFNRFASRQDRPQASTPS